MNSIDPTGLVRRVGIAIPNGYGPHRESHNNTFRDIVSRSSDAWEDKNTGQDILDYLIEMSKDNCPIELLTIAGHGWGYQSMRRGINIGIPGVGLNVGLYSDSYFELFRLPYIGTFSWRPIWIKLWGAARVTDLKEKIEQGEIKFAENCTIQIYGCRIADSFTRELAKATKCRVVTAASSCRQYPPDPTLWQSAPGRGEEVKTCPKTEFYEIIPCPSGGTVRRDLNELYRPCTSVPCTSQNITRDTCLDVRGDVYLIDW